GFRARRRDRRPAPRAYLQTARPAHGRHAAGFSISARVGGDHGQALSAHTGTRRTPPTPTPTARATPAQLQRDPPEASPHGEGKTQTPPKPGIVGRGGRHPR